MMSTFAEESDAEPEEEEPTIESYEIDFDLNRFLHKYVCMFCCMCQRCS